MTDKAKIFCQFNFIHPFPSAQNSNGFIFTYFLNNRIMKNLLHLFFFLTPLLFYSCSESVPYGDAIENPKDILKNGSCFTNYWIRAMDLSTNFVGLDPSSKQIPKETFLQQVATGKFLPLRLSSDSASKIYYRLYKLDTIVDPYLPAMLRSIGAVAYKDFKWEGLPLPEINYTDLNGIKFNSDFIKGKTLVLDFWFIGCTACVEEFPDLNKLRNKYANRKDIIFAAVAFDKEASLRKFLKKTNLQFDVISETSRYLIKKLDIQSFPSIVVVKNGKVVKILDDQYHCLPDLKMMLRKEVQDQDL